MTKKELIYTVFERLKINSDDMDITEEFVSFLIDSKRAMLLKQRFDAKPWAMPLETKQEICVNLELTARVPGFECVGTILRSDAPLPESIKIKGKEGPLTIRKTDKTAIHVNIIPLERLPYIGSNRALAMMIYGAIDYDNRLYLISQSGKINLMTDIRVADIFEKPDVAAELECTADSETECEIWDREYPVELSMVDDIVKLVVQDLVKTINIPEDGVNNADGERTKA